jgi:hypothetical protein
MQGARKSSRTGAHNQHIGIKCFALNGLLFARHAVILSDRLAGKCAGNAEWKYERI